MKKLISFFVIVVSLCANSFSAQNGVSYNTLTRTVAQTDLIIVLDELTATGSLHAVDDYISLSGQTNRISVSGGQFLFDGYPLNGTNIFIISELWTNIGSGNLQIIGSTNVTIDTNGNGSFEGILAAVQILATDGSTNAFMNLNPTAADGASAVAYQFDTVNPFVTPGAKLLTVGNEGTNVNQISYTGGNEIGRNVGGWFGSSPNNMSVAVWDAAFGEPTSGSVYYSTVDDASADNLSAELGWAGSSVDARSTLNVKGAGNTSTWNIILDADPEGNGGSINVTRNTLSRLFLNPSAADGTTPYTFDTSITHTSGNLQEVKNMGTNTFTIAAVSGYSGAGTLFLSDDGTYKSGGSVNPSSGVVPFNSSGFFANSLIQMGDVQTVIIGGLTNPTTLSLKSFDTTSSSAYLNGFMFDSNGQAEVGLITFAKAGTWGGAASDRDGSVGINTLHDNASYNRLNIDGDTGDFTFFDRIGNALSLTISNAGQLTTAVPSSATNALPFRIGQTASAVGLVLVTTNYVQMDINGVAVKLATVQ